MKIKTHTTARMRFTIELCDIDSNEVLGRVVEMHDSHGATTDEPTRAARVKLACGTLVCLELYHKLRIEILENTSWIGGEHAYGSLRSHRAG